MRRNGFGGMLHQMRRNAQLNRARRVREREIKKSQQHFSSGPDYDGVGFDSQIPDFGPGYYGYEGNDYYTGYDYPDFGYHGYQYPGYSGYDPYVGFGYGERLVNVPGRPPVGP